MPSLRSLLAILTPLLAIAALLLVSNSARPAQAGSSDVMIEAMYVSPSVVNQPFTVQINVRNNGESGTGEFWVDFYPHLEDPPQSHIPGADACRMDPMGPMSERYCEVSTTYLAAGMYTYYVSLDREGEVWESDETNNMSGPNYVFVQDDSDFDGVGDQDDNCLFWPNPLQLPPPWTVPPGDSDCDGFTNPRETYLGTDMTLQCANDTTPNNEAGADHWPFDMNDDGKATTVDVGRFVGKLGKDNTEVGWTARLDLNQSPNGIINTVDVGLYVGRLGDSCAPSGP